MNVTHYRFSAVFSAFIVLAISSDCVARPRQGGDDPAPPVVGPELPDPPTPEVIAQQSCRDAWYLAHDVKVDGDPFAIVRQKLNTWDLSAEIDGERFEVVPASFVEYTLSVSRPSHPDRELVCRIPTKWKATAMRVEIVPLDAARDVETSSYARDVRAIGGLVFRKHNFPSRPMLSVNLAWFVKAGSFDNFDEQAVRNALRIGMPFPIKFEANPLQFADPRRPGLAVAFSTHEDPLVSTVRYWGILSEPIRNSTSSPKKIGHFFPFVEQPKFADLDTALDSVNFQNIQNLSLWDAQLNRRVPCLRAGSDWKNVCGNIFPFYAEEWRQQTVDAGTPGFVHFVWKTAGDGLLLSTAEISPRGDVNVLRTVAIDDPASLGLPDEATMWSLPWP